MSLLVDGDHVSLSDLMVIDSEVSAIAEAEELSVSGIIAQAWSEFADKLRAEMPIFDDWDQLGPVGAAHGLRSGASRVRLVEVVVTSHIKRCLIYTALRLFYRAATNRKVTDRMEAKMDRAATEEREAWSRLRVMGLRVNSAPLPCPGAAHETNAGVFAASSVSAIAGGSGVSTVAYDVAITWTDEAGVESGPSAMVSISVPAGQTIRVSIAALNPPGSYTIPFDPTEGMVWRRKATGWNVYVCRPDATPIFYRQNETPIAVGTKTFSLASDPTMGGTMLWQGQAADSVLSFQNMLLRG